MAFPILSQSLVFTVLSLVFSRAIFVFQQQAVSCQRQVGGVAVLLELAQQILPLLPFLWAPAAEVGSQLLPPALGGRALSIPTPCILCRTQFCFPCDTTLRFGRFSFPLYVDFLIQSSRFLESIYYILCWVGCNLEQKLRRNTTLGDNLRRLRKAAGLTQAMAVAQLQLLGFDISREILSQTENGRCPC